MVWCLLPITCQPVGDILWFFIWNRIIVSIFRNDVWWGLFMLVRMKQKHNY